MKKHIVWIGFLCSLPSVASPADEAAPAPPAAAPSEVADAYSTWMAEGQKSVAHREAKALEAGADAFEKALVQRPNDLDATLAAADALIRLMRVQTGGNHLLFDSPNDTPAHRQIWKKWGPRALELTRVGVQKRPNDVWARALYAEAYMYKSASSGIIDAILDGAASEYLNNADFLMNTQPPYDLASGHVYKASFYTIAPWPLSDADKSIEHARKAAQLFPNSVRNNYVWGIVAYRQKNMSEAKEALQKSLAGRCTTPSEKDLCAWFRKEAQRALNAIAP